MTLSKDLCQRLAAGFPPDSIKWKIQGNPPDAAMQEREGKKYGPARVVAYLDARDVAERLDQVLEGNWCSTYRILYPPPMNNEFDNVVVEATLSIGEIYRSDVGNGGDFKDAYSDALKRAAVLYGVGRFLYRLPGVKAEVVQYGKGYYLTPASERELLTLNTAIMAGDDRLPTFTKLQVHGYTPIVNREGLPL